MGTAHDHACSSAALATLMSFLPGAGGTKDREGWWWWRAGKQTMRLKRQKSIGNEASLVWLPVGQLVN